MTIVELMNDTCKQLSISKEILAGKLRERGVKISHSSLYKWGKGWYKPSPNTERVVREELTKMLEAASLGRMSTKL